MAVYLLLFYSFTVCLFRGKERQRNPLFFRSYYCFIHMAIAVTFIVRPIFEDHVFWTIFAEGTKRNTLIQRSVKYLVRRLAVAIHRRLLAQVRRALAQFENFTAGQKTAFRSSATTRDLSQGLANWLEKKRRPATYRRADDQGTISSPVAPPGLKFLPAVQRRR